MANGFIDRILVNSFPLLCSPNGLFTCHSNVISQYYWDYRWTTNGGRNTSDTNSLYCCL